MLLRTSDRKPQGKLGNVVIKDLRPKASDSEYSDFLGRSGSGSLVEFTYIAAYPSHALHHPANTIAAALLHEGAPVYTHFLTIHFHSVALLYMQTLIWHLLDYLVTGHLARLGQLASRPVYSSGLKHAAPATEYVGNQWLHLHMLFTDCIILLPASLTHTAHFEARAGHTSICSDMVFATHRGTRDPQVASKLTFSFRGIELQCRDSRGSDVLMTGASFDLVSLSGWRNQHQVVSPLLRVGSPHTS